ncbi:hypothetical protein COLO4_29197 [Corchorus olitorius]|uniref:F-box domain-containing protein n=1 Tax=Corchorus olitorius TaxID=93759 RepID=A0A1R3HFR3_9ROSI|nr:hypothetical protein COLO4_29197 [Corchorus olitorius]
MEPKMKKQKTTIVQFFPDDIIVDIMAALPFKSILRFRCLSKSWQAVLTSSRFNQSKTKSDDMQRIIVSSGETFGLIKDEANTKMCTLEFPLKSLKQDKYIIGCCNGLLLLLVPGEGMILWNPSTRECQKLPFPRRISNHVPGKFGFGYDQSTDNFKVIILDYFLSSAHIYSLRSNTWKKISGFPSLFTDESKSGTLVDDFLYWSTETWVLGFNLKSDKFEKIRPPKDIKQFHSPLGLGVIEGCLSLAQNHHGFYLNIWKLTKTSQSWIKITSIKNLQELPDQHCWVPYCIMNNGEFLLTYFNDEVFIHGYPKTERCQTLRFGLYDPVNGKLRSLPTVHDMSHYRQAVTYVESLVSPIVCIDSSSTLQLETKEFTDLYGKDWSKRF